MPVNHETTSILPGLLPICGRPIELRFNGGMMSSDGGILALRLMEQGLGSARRLATRLPDHRRHCSQSTLSRAENLPDIRMILKRLCQSGIGSRMDSQTRRTFQG